MLIVRLIEEHIFPVSLSTLCRPILEVAVRGDTVFLT
jgi:hypothetical protein